MAINPNTVKDKSGCCCRAASKNFVRITRPLDPFHRPKEQPFLLNLNYTPPTIDLFQENRFWPYCPTSRHTTLRRFAAKPIFPKRVFDWLRSSISVAMLASSLLLTNMDFIQHY
jgi:hypothetical protein